jgi:hypothetical protein
MFEHLIYPTYLLLFLFSIIGYGFLFSVTINKNLFDLDFGLQGLIGFFTLYTISLISTFFFAHGYIFNFIIHSLGISSFIYFYINNKITFSNQLKEILIIFLLLLIGIYIFKNHDDFPYYHLTYSLNLSNSSFIVGTGVFSHGFKTSSSLFYFHSLLYLPYIEYYLFHSGPFYIMIFFNYYILNKLRSKFLNKQIDFIYYFSLLNFIFVNVVFYRLGEHGTDRSAQILLLIIFIVFFELLLLKKNKAEKNKSINFLLIGIFLASSMKALFYIYLILVPIILFSKNFFKNYLLNIKNYKLLTILCFSFFLTLLTNFLSTGCLIYPAEKTCLGEFEWSVPKEQVKVMKVHYEWWAKAGGGPGFNDPLPKDQYIKDFNWIRGWIDRHFFNKVSDTLLGTLLISLLVVLAFRNKKKKRLEFKNFKLIYFILLIFFTEWFFNHPSMRYGGFVLISLPIFIFSSQIIESFKKMNQKRIFSLTIMFICLSFVIYNARNIIRLNKEINFYNYKLIKSPFFFVKDVKSKVVFENDSFIVYSPIDNMCWASSTPCSYARSLEVSDFFHMKVVKNKIIQP